MVTVIRVDVSRDLNLSYHLLSCLHVNCYLIFIKFHVRFFDIKRYVKIFIPIDSS